MHIHISINTNTHMLTHRQHKEREIEIWEIYSKEHSWQ